MPRRNGLGASLLIATLCASAVGPVAAQTQSDFSTAAAYFDGPDFYNLLSCDDPVETGACTDEAFCAVKLGMLQRVTRAMDTNLPSVMLGASQSAMSDYLRNEENAACFDGLTTSYRDFIPNIGLIASGTEGGLTSALGLADAFAEDVPGCPSPEREGLTVARYDASELSRQVFFPLKALGKNSAATCLPGFTGHFTQRPQVTFHIAEPADHEVEFQVVYSPCRAVLLAATAAGDWVASERADRRQTLRLSGAQIDGKISIWVGTKEPGGNCDARFAARLASP